MTEIKGFILALCATSAASALIEGLIPEGGTKKYVNYLISLTVLLVLLSPLTALVKNVPTRLGDMLSYDGTDAIARAGGLVASHIRDSLCHKFSLDNGQVSCVWDGKTVIVRTVKRHGLIADDIKIFILNNFGVGSEVEFYE